MFVCGTSVHVSQFTSQPHSWPREKNPFFQKAHVVRRRELIPKTAAPNGNLSTVQEISIPCFERHMWSEEESLIPNHSTQFAI
jgi:hypothetical protein